MKNTNETMMQYFEWYLPPDATLWKKVAADASYLSTIGITHVWLPPAYKGSSGITDTGYAVYDLYDLGEFHQKDSIVTKYGTKEEYLEAIKVLRANNVKVLADIVFNQKIGADETEDIIAIEDNPQNRNENISEPKMITAWTKFTFPGRNKTYSDFTWNWTHFHGVDWDEKEKKTSVYRFYGKHWDSLVDKENGNFDYLMGCDVDLNNVDVVEELIRWGKWYVQNTHVDGFRIDAAKHIRSSFFEDWLTVLRNDLSYDLFTVGEYWSTNIDALHNYMIETKEMISLFDVPLHYHFFEASHSNGTYDMRTIFQNTLVKSHPDKCVTFVDNHDTQIGQSLESWIEDWFKPIAYSLILLRLEGIPCIFYGDFYGIPYHQIDAKKQDLELLLRARKFFAYGHQTDYLDDPTIIGWTRQGDYEHPDSGMAVILSIGSGGCKQMNVGPNLANSILYDCTGHLQETVYVDQEGNGIFYVDGGSVSVWIKKHNMYEN